LDYIRERFARSARDYARGLAMGEIMAPTFTNDFQLLIETWFPEAFFAGMAACDVNIDSVNDLEADERDTLYGEMTTDLIAVSHFGGDIETGRYGPKEDFAGRGVRASVFNSIYSRVELYVVRLNHFYDLGQAAGCGNKMMIWNLGKTSEHCSDCKYYDGQVHRMSTWVAHGALPRTHGLECGGWRCDCQLTPTTERANGRLRRPSNA